MTLNLITTKQIASIIAKSITAGCELEHFKLSDDWAGARGNNAAMAIAELFDDENPDGELGTLRRFLIAEQEANRAHAERNQKMHQTLGMQFGENEYIHERVERVVQLLTKALDIVEHPSQFTVEQRIELSRAIHDVLPHDLPKPAKPKLNPSHFVCEHGVAWSEHCPDGCPDVDSDGNIISAPAPKEG